MSLKIGSDGRRLGSSHICSLFQNKFQLALKIVPLAFWNCQMFAEGLRFLMLLTVLFLFAVIIISNSWSGSLIIQEHLSMSGDVLVATVVGCHWHLVGRGQQCCSTS